MYSRGSIRAMRDSGRKEWRTVAITAQLHEKSGFFLSQSAIRGRNLFTCSFSHVFSVFSIFFGIRSPALPYRILKLSRSNFLYLSNPVIECRRIPAKDIKIPTRVSKNIQIADSKLKFPPGPEVCIRLKAICSPPVIRIKPGRVKQYRGLLNSMSLKVLNRIQIPCLKGLTSERVASHI